MILDYLLPNFLLDPIRFSVSLFLILCAIAYLILKDDL